MEFCSGYVYVYDSPDYEYISDEEFEEGMNISMSDDSDSSENVSDVMSRSSSSCSYSPPLRRRRRSSESPPPRRRRRSSESPPPRRRRRSSESPPPRRRRRSSESPPPRRRRRSSESPPPRRRRRSSESPPPRRRRRSSESPPPRRRTRNSESPPPRYRRRSPDSPPPRYRRRSPDSPPPRYRRRSSESPPPRYRRRSPDYTPLRRRKRSSDAPPPGHKRRVLKKKLNRHWRTAGSAHLDAVPPSHQNHRRVRQGDTNVVTVKFDNLTSPSNMHAGDVRSCTQCGAILSALSKLTHEEDKKVWSCEFCDTRNVLDIEDEEKPRDADVTFMLEPASSTSASGPTGLDESLVVFCVDQSGSMDVTTEVPGHVELRGITRNRSERYSRHQRQDVTYVSRLQCVQAAVDHQLQEMAKDFPNRRVALISFSDKVTVFGDGNADPIYIPDYKLDNKDTLMKIATEQPLPDSIKNTRHQLGKELFDMEECGPTALGPALLVASTMAAKVKGSKVILCTDGLANLGVGKLDCFDTNREKDESIVFYEQVSDTAVENGVSISVVTIKGTRCKLVELGKMADKTGGQVNIVDPLKLTQEFSTILAEKVIATNVEATFILHKELFFFYEDSEDSKVVKNIGNVTAGSEYSFEYGIRTKSEEDKKSEKKLIHENSEDKKHLLNVPSGSSETDREMAGVAECSYGRNDKNEVPFQLQFVYTDKEGAKALRVITQTKPITRDRKKAEQSAKIDVLARHTAMNTARMAQDGLYTIGRERALMNQRVAWRHSRENNDAESRPDYRKKFEKIKTMENYLNLRQKTEVRTRGRRLSESYSEGDDDFEVPPVGASDNSKPVPSRKRKFKHKSFLSRLKKKREDLTDDAGAALVFNGKSSKSFFEDSD